LIVWAPMLSETCRRVLALEELNRLGLLVGLWRRPSTVSVPAPLPPARERRIDRRLPPGDDSDVVDAGALVERLEEPHLIGAGRNLDRVFAVEVGARLLVGADDFDAGVDHRLTGSLVEHLAGDGSVPSWGGRRTRRC
jgi:hypothetical protein